MFVIYPISKSFTEPWQSLKPQYAPAFGAIRCDVDDAVVAHNHNQRSCARDRPAIPNYKFKEKALNNFLTVSCFYTTKGRGKWESSSFDLTHFPGIAFI